MDIDGASREGGGREGEERRGEERRADEGMRERERETRETERKPHSAEPERQQEPGAGDWSGAPGKLDLTEARSHCRPACHYDGAALC
jgi:hypothetical protein